MALLLKLQKFGYAGAVAVNFFKKELYYFSNIEGNNENLLKSPQLETFIEKKRNK